MHITCTHHIAVLTAHFEEMREFYVKTLGMPIRGAFEGYNIVFVDAGSTAIEIVENAGERAPEDSWRHLALEVPDIDAAYNELLLKGVPFHVPPKDFPPAAPKVRIAFFRDPDGNELELVQPLGTRYPIANLFR